MSRTRDVILAVLVHLLLAAATDLAWTLGVFNSPGTPG